MSSEESRFIQQITDATKGKRHIFRGEASVEFEYSCSSSLYRQLKKEKVPESEIPERLETRQDERLKEIRHLKSEGNNDQERLMTYQHKGGKTNLLDFTGGLLVALFFACYEKEHSGKDGWLIIKSRDGFRELDAEEIPPKDKAVLLIPPDRLKRAKDQRAVLLRVPKGVLPYTDEERILIKSELKKGILSILENVHDVSHKTVFDDIEGDITLQNREDEMRVSSTIPSGTNLQGFAKPENNQAALIMGYYVRILRSNTARGPYVDLMRSYAKELIASLTGILKANPKSAEAYYNRALVYQSKLDPNHKKAILDYTSALKLNPNHATAYNNRGLAHMTKPNPDYDQAISDYTIALELNPGYLEAYYNRGSAYMNRSSSDCEKAILDYTSALKLNPNHATAYNNRGIAYMKKPSPDYDRAISDYNSALKLNPNLVGTYINRGIVYMAKPDPDYELAMQDYNRAIELNPDYAVGYSNRGLAYTQGPTPDFDKAISDLNRAIKLKPDFAEAFNNRGVVYKGKPTPDFDRAILDFNRAINLNSNYVKAYVNRCIAYTEKPEPNCDKAILDCNRAIRLNPNYAEAYSSRGIAYASKPNPDYAQVISDFNKALELDPNYAGAYYNRSLAYMKKYPPDLGQALKDCRKSIELNPQYGPAYYIRAILHKEQGDHANARKDYDKGLEIAPEMAKLPGLLAFKEFLAHSTGINYQTKR